MPERDENLSKFWAVGASYGGTKDKTKFFLDNNIWQDGWGVSGDPVNKSILDQIDQGLPDGSGKPGAKRGLVADSRN